MKVYINKEEIILEKKLGSGGEGDVYEWKDKAIKIYKDINKINKEKLLDLIKIEKINNCIIPEDIVYNIDNSIIGYSMKKISNCVSLVHVYSSKLRRIKNLNIDFRFLNYVAINLTLLLNRIHKRNIIIGDLKPQNILVNNKGEVFLIDFDSVQFNNYFCNLATPDFSPPELKDKVLSETTQTKHQDNFRLSILIYLLLTGEHPFKNTGITISIYDNILSNNWTRQKNNILNEEIYNLFLRCFDGSLLDRPSSEEWYITLLKNYKLLKKCDKEEKHYYYQDLNNCCWCNLTYDIFTFKQNKENIPFKRINDFMHFPSNVFIRIEDKIKSSKEVKNLIRLDYINKKNIKSNSRIHISRYIFYYYFNSLNYFINILNTKQFIKVEGIFQLENVGKSKIYYPTLTIDTIEEFKKFCILNDITLEKNAR